MDNTVVDWGELSDEEENEYPDAGGEDIVSTESQKDKKKWSKKPTKEAKWHPPEGLFDKSADEIAKTLKKESKDYKQASSRLNFYINRAGKNLSEKDKKRLASAKKKLKALYEDEKNVSQECYHPPSATW